MNVTAKNLEPDDDILIPKGTPICERKDGSKRYYVSKTTQQVSIDFIFDEGFAFNCIFTPRLVWIETGRYFEVGVRDAFAVK